MASKRRGLLGSIAIFLFGSGALWFVQGGDVDQLDVDGVELPDTGGLSGPPPTENKISETGSLQESILEATTGVPIDNIEFFESGAAVVHPAKGRDECQTDFALLYKTQDFGVDGTRNDPEVDTSPALETWSFGDFDEPVTVDFKSAIQSQSNYPSNEFRINVYAEGETCLRDRSEPFEVPETYVTSE